MSKSVSLILLEFNELTPSLMERFMADGKLPNFERFWQESYVYVTDARERRPNLNPWIQWVTVHSGLPFSEHRIFHLGEGHKLKKKCIWDLLSEAGLRSWVCGSMNVRYGLPLNGHVLPDTWTTEAVPYPDLFGPYFQFVQQNVLEHSNMRVPLRWKDYWAFLRFMIGHGLSAGTAASIFRQLVAERINHQRWKRTVILDKLQFDLFRWNYLRLRPHFSTFFLNSTAHFQHMYWRNMAPELFRAKPEPEEQARCEEAILFGYQEMDRLLGRFVELAGENTILVFCTALSQQPCLLYEEQGGKSFYRPRDFEALLKYAGVTGPRVVSPVMSEQFHVLFENEKDAPDAEARLRALRVAGTPALAVERKAAAIFAGCSIFYELPRDVVLEIPGRGLACPFFDVFYQVEGKKSGMHHPDGMLWIRYPDRKHFVHREKVPLTAVAPSILDLFGVPVPGYMKEKPLGRRASEQVSAAAVGA